MKNEGVTILQIVIAIVIMIIIATVAIYYAQTVPSETRIVSVYNEIKEVRGAINEAKILDEIEVIGADKGKLSFFNGEITVNKVNNSEYTTQLDGSTGTYYYLDFTSSRKLENVLELENVNNDYLLDYENMHIYIIKGVNILSKEEGSNKDKIETRYKDEEIEKYYNNTFRNS